ncbi:MAG: 3-dehydroquinate synthase [Chitinivibrionales bacterium]|nr:3-dehydroquinate synthase [Chitinivibrionales bacterium]
MIYMQELRVELADRSYPIVLGGEMAAGLPKRLIDMFPDARFALVTNTTLKDLYRDHLSSWKSQLQFVEHVMPDGEEYKSLECWREILATLLTTRGLDRRSVVCAFGGGVVGDIAGFAAASFLRGVNYVQIPTTLLAMVDSSVGGKTGVNHASGKNRIGAFFQPRLVWADTEYLTTLQEREFLAGYAELFKYAFIGGEDMFAFVMSRHDAMLAREPEILTEGIRRSMQIKARVVSQDEKESGMRALLNYGHTFGHSLERSFKYAGILHGEAVLWGMACACDLGKRAGTIPAEHISAYDAICKIMPTVQLPARPPVDELYQGMFTDKKTHGATIRFVLPAQPGTSIITSDVATEDVLATLENALA